MKRKSYIIMMPRNPSRIRERMCIRLTRVETRSEDKRKQVALAEKARYQREWNKRNPDKKREYNLRYWERKAMKRLAQEEGHTEPSE